MDNYFYDMVDKGDMQRLHYIPTAGGFVGWIEKEYAFLPCNQPYTMTVEQLVRAAQVIAPKVLIPYHFSQTPVDGIPSQFPGIDVRLRKMQ